MEAIRVQQLAIAAGVAASATGIETLRTQFLAWSVSFPGEALGTTLSTGASTTMLLTSGWWQVPAGCNRVTWSSVGLSWATLYIDGRNSATSPAYAETGVPLNGSTGTVIGTGSNASGFLWALKYMKWHVEGSVPVNVSGVISWRATP
jgi:hypothetical protein